MEEDHDCYGTGKDKDIKKEEKGKGADSFVKKGDAADKGEKGQARQNSCRELETFGLGISHPRRKIEKGDGRDKKNDGKKGE